MVGGMGTRIQAFLERYFSHPSRLYIGFSYIILLHRVFLMFELHRVFLMSAAPPTAVVKSVFPRTAG
jgi:hypothetical protein